MMWLEEHGNPVRVAETQVKQKDKFWLWREGEEDV